MKEGSPAMAGGSPRAVGRNWAYRGDGCGKDELLPRSEEQTTGHNTSAIVTVRL